MPEVEILAKSEAATAPPAVSRIRVRDRAANGLMRLAKVFGTSVPPEIAAAEVASGMDAATPFSPGSPLSPYDGYSRTPKQQNFTPQYNVSARPRTHERVSFETLRGLIDAYDIAQIAIWHRIDSIRSLEWSLVAADGYEGDVSDAVAIGMKALRKPDGETPFGAWLGAWLYDTLAYDAGTLWRMRNRAGQATGLMYVDGTSVAPLLDDWGRTPQAPAPAYVQYSNGLPWNWLTTNDLIYKPFRKIPGSPYGRAPLESILLNANTDLRTQAYFLQRYTEGNLPAAFASAPESWTPQQIEQFQEYWDAFLLGDQSFKAQVRWIPPGSKIEWSNEKDFSDEFSLHMLRKTFAAYHVVPSDAGFTQEVNKSSGETQSDVQHRLGDVPLAKHVDGIFTSFLQDDLVLPIKFQFDFGEEQDDRLQTAQADDIYAKMGAISVSDIRELRYGLSEPDGQRVPRFIFSNRGGPIPLSALESVAGPIDQESGAPEPGAALPHKVFQPVEGVEAQPPTPRPPLAVTMYGPGALPDAAPQAAKGQPAAPVAKDGPTAGITAATGITSYDLVGQHDGEDGPPTPKPVITKGAEVRAVELAAFRSFVKGRKRDGKWRDFGFTAIGPVKAHRLNDSGRLAVRKAAGQVAVAGLAVLAADTGRVLMLQRALDDEDPAAGCWEFPGGHLEADESPLQGAAREWAEETGCTPPAGIQVATWISPDGIYQGIVWLIGHETDVPVFDGRDQVTNPDDPDGDQVEAIAWWNPTQLPDNPAMRPELLDSIDTVMDALTTVTVAKAAGGGQVPKADASAKEARHWPAWDHDEAAADYWTQKLTDGLTGALTQQDAEALARDYAATNPGPRDGRTDAELTAPAAAWLATRRLNLKAPIAAALTGTRADGAAIGAASAHASLGKRATADMGTWKPGDTAAARAVLSGLDPDADPDDLTADDDDPDVQDIADTRMGKLAAALAIGTAAGQSAGAVGRALRTALTAGLRTVALTELIGAVSRAAISLFRRSKVQNGRWIADPRKSCPVCIANSKADPRPFGQPYPSGSAFPPEHPNCACAVVDA